MKIKFNKITAAAVFLVLFLQLTPLSVIAAYAADETEIYYAEGLLYQDGYLGEIPKYTAAKTESGSLSRSGGLSEATYVSYSAAVNALASAMQSRVNNYVSLTRYRVLQADILSLFSAAVNSNPQLFYIDNAFSYNASRGYVATLYFNFKYSRAEITAMTEKFNAAAADALAACMGTGMTGMTEAQKALAGHDYIAALVNYDMSAVNAPDTHPNAFTAYGALVERKAVCQGISLAYKYLMKQSGVACEFVSSESMVHGWNAVKVDGYWYHVDITWDDPVLTFKNTKTDVDGKVYHDYFLLSDDAIRAKRHYGWTMDVVGLDDASFIMVYASSRKYDYYYWQNITSKMCYKDGYFYFAKDDYIKKCRLDGANQSAVPNSYGAVSIDADQSHIYFATANQIKAMSFSGENLRTVSSNISGGIYGLKYCNNYIYYHYDYGNNHSIASSNLIYVYDYTYYKYNNNELRITGYTGDGGELTVPERLLGCTVTQIYELAFQNKANITKISFPSTLKAIPQLNLTGCTSLKDVVFPIAGEYKLILDDYDITVNKTAGGSSLCIDRIKAAGRVEIPYYLLGGYTAKAISANAAKNNYKITELILPYSVSEIGDYAFYGCGSLKKVSFTSNIKSIGAYAFAYCYNLSDTTLPGGLTYLGERAFVNTKLGDVILPSGIKDNYTISDTPFYSAVSSVTSGGFSAEITSNQASITAYGGSEKNLRIPSVIAGFPVVGISQGAFRNNKSLESVILPDSVEEIGAYAFSGCEKLTKISSNGMEDFEIGTLPPSLYYLGAMAFENTAIASIIIPDSLYYVGHLSSDGAYKGPFAGSGLKKAYFDPEATSVYEYLFAGAASLENVELDGISVIMEYAFADCICLKTVNFTQELTKINAFAFKGCTGLSVLNLPATLKSIGVQAFEDCTAVESVNIPKELSVYVPRNAKTVKGPFSGCSLLTTVTFEEGRTNIPFKLFENCVSLDNTVIPDGVTNIGSYAFKGCTALKNLTLPQSLKTIGDYAFENTALETLALPVGVTNICTGAFYNCRLLDTLTLPDTLAVLGERAFGGTAIASVNIPASLTSAQTAVTDGRITGPFADCESLKNFAFESGVTEVIEGLFASCGSIETVKLPYSVKYIAENAFAYCSGLREVYISQTLSSVHPNGFYGSNLCLDENSVIFYVEGSIGERFALDFSAVNACSARPLQKITKAASGASIEGASIQSYISDVTLLDFSAIPADSSKEQEQYCDMLSNINKIEIRLGDYDPLLFYGAEIAIPIENGIDPSTFAVYDGYSNRLPYKTDESKSVMIVAVTKDVDLTIGSCIIDRNNITMSDALAAFKCVAGLQSFSAAQMLRFDYDMDACVTLLDVLRMLLILKKA